MINNLISELKISNRVIFISVFIFWININFTFISNYLFFHYFTLLLNTVIYLFFALGSKSISVTKFDLVFLILLLYLIIRSLITPYYDEVKFLSILSLFLLYISLKLIGLSNNLFRGFIHFLLLFFITQFFSSIFHSFIYLKKIDYRYINGSFFNTGVFSCILSVIFPLFFTVENRWRQYFNTDKVIFIGLLIFSCLFILIKSRLGLICLSINCLIIFTNKSSVLNIKKKIFFIFSFFIISALLLINFEKSNSFFGRLIFYKVFFNEGLEYVNFLGNGFNSFSKTFSEIQSDFFENAFIVFKTDHRNVTYHINTLSEPIRFVIENGFIFSIITISLITLLLFYVSNTKSLNHKSYFFFIRLSILNYFIISLFYYPTSIPFLSFILIFLLAKASYYSSIYLEIIFDSRVKNIMKVIFILFVILIVTVKGFTVTYKYFVLENMVKANKSSNDFINFMQENTKFIEKNPSTLYILGKMTINVNINQSISFLEKSFRYFGEPVSSEMLGKLSSDYGNFEISKYYFKKSISQNPRYVYPKFLLMNCYIKTNQKDSANIVAKNILETPYQSSLIYKEVIDSVHIFLQKQR